MTMEYEPIQLAYEFAILVFEIYLQCYWQQTTKVRAIFQNGFIFIILHSKAVYIKVSW